MKEIIKHLFLFSVFAIAFSAITACGDSSAVNIPQAADKTPQPTGTTTDETAKSSEYPPLSSKLANAEIHLLDGTITTPGEQKGKVVLLNLWGIWCGPCVYEMPHLVEMQKKYNDSGFEIIGLNVGNEDLEPENIDAIKEFAEKMGLNYTLARIDNQVSEDFARETKFTGVPLSVLVDRDGHLRGVFGGAGASSIRKMRETVEKVVNES